MFVNIYISEDSKFYLYLPFQGVQQTILESYTDLPEYLVKKFKGSRFFRTVNTDKQTLRQIKDIKQFATMLEEQGFYLCSIETELLEHEIKESLGIK